LAAQLPIKSHEANDNYVPYGGSDDLKIHVHDGAAFRFEIEGSLSGKGAKELEQSWCTASSVIGDRSLVISAVNVNRIDQVVRDHARYREVYQPTVVDSKAIATGEAKSRVSKLLANKSFFLKTALDTDCESCEVHLDDRRVCSVSRTTRIQEIKNTAPH